MKVRKLFREQVRHVLAYDEVDAETIRRGLEERDLSRVVDVVFPYDSPQFLGLRIVSMETGLDYHREDLRTALRERLEEIEDLARRAETLTPAGPSGRGRRSTVE